MASRLVLALDETDPVRACRIAEEVAPFVAAIKINYPLVLSSGLGIVTEISKFAKVICDFKVADIPNTNRLITESVFKAGAQGIIAHAFPGSESLKAIREVDSSKDLFVVITMSHPRGGDFFDIEAFCSLALEVGATGVIAPATRPEDISQIRDLIGSLKIMSPGVGAQGGNSKEALKAGADFIIVGRGIYLSDNPAKAAEQYSRDLEIDD
jgi:orotidine-5'-phosphate decarboxylase